MCSHPQLHFELLSLSQASMATIAVPRWLPAPCEMQAWK